MSWLNCCQPEGDRTHLFDRAIEKAPGAPSTLSNGTNTTFISLISASHTEDTTYSWSEKMYDAAVQQIAQRVVRQDMSAQEHHSDVSGQSGSIARWAHSPERKVALEHQAEQTCASHLVIEWDAQFRRRRAGKPNEATTELLRRQIQKHEHLQQNQQGVRGHLSEVQQEVQVQVQQVA